MTEAAMREASMTTVAARPVSNQAEAVGCVQVCVVLVAALGFAFDLGEIALGSALSGVFSAPPHVVAPSQLSWLLAATYVGAIIGPAAWPR